MTLNSVKTMLVVATLLGGLDAVFAQNVTVTNGNRSESAPGVPNPGGFGAGDFVPLRPAGGPPPVSSQFDRAMREMSGNRPKGAVSGDPAGGPRMGGKSIADLVAAPGKPWPVDPRPQGKETGMNQTAKDDKTQAKTSEVPATTPGPGADGYWEGPPEVIHIIDKLSEFRVWKTDFMRIGDSYFLRYSWDEDYRPVSEWAYESALRVNRDLAGMTPEQARRLEVCAGALNEMADAIVTIASIHPVVGWVNKIVQAMEPDRDPIQAYLDNISPRISSGPRGAGPRPDETREPARLLPPAKSPAPERGMPGAARGGERLANVKDRWLRGTDGNLGRIPQPVADKLRGRSFKSFDDFRKAFWEHVAEHPNLLRELERFDAGNGHRLRDGRAPICHPSQHLADLRTGAPPDVRHVYTLHHVTPINQGGRVYDLDNIIVVTPRLHRHLLTPEYHYGK